MLNLKKEAIFILVVTFFIGLVTILSFNGDTNKCQPIPNKWRNAGNQMTETTSVAASDSNTVEQLELKIKYLQQQLQQHKQQTTDSPFNKIDKLYKENEQKNIERSNEIKGAMQFAWEKYKQYAWGKDELQPLTRDHKEWFGLGLSIVDSLDTLKIMGLEKEYKEGRDWVEFELKQSKNTGMSVSVFETIIRVLGSHVTMYGLTKDKMYLDKAKEMGDLLLYAFPEDGSPFPASSLVLATHQRGYPSWTGGCVILSEIGTIFLEFNELSKITGDPKYKEYSDKVVNAISKLRTDKPGLLPVFLNKEGTGFCNNMISVGGLGDSYYEYLLKMWLYTNGEEEIYKTLFVQSADSIIKYMYKVSPKGDGYITSLEGGSPSNRQEHLTCFAGGMFALAAAANITGDDEKSRKYMEVGEMVTRTCAKAYMITETGLAPESYYIDPNNGDIRWHGYSTLSWYILRPETVESLFILYRLTGDIQYQDWSWKIFEAIQDVCKKEDGYAGLKNVDDRNDLDNNQQSFFMAETMKYLYLSFQPSNVIPLDRYVFNTEAHPIPMHFTLKN
ncbi:hypothetical protein RB653_005903 [Dictyostelium firmibasis]|uniref:alpha-1,2-Mannosidase n=1 Tax=Dictyostelium firmibasis TaxID=79012 RepID=A0AAN7UDH0_9MYCE